jgi:hypothetical protein
MAEREAALAHPALRGTCTSLCGGILTLRVQNQPSQNEKGGQTAPFFILAEREGFEPSIQV